MSRGNRTLDLKLQLSPPGSKLAKSSDMGSSTSSEMSIAGSCVSSEPEQESILQYESSSEVTSMVVLGCRSCLMYVMSSKVDPKCPRCNCALLLLDCLNEESLLNKNTKH